MTRERTSPAGNADRPDDVGEENVERLLSVAYEPEVPNPAFAERVRKRMRSAARGRRQAARPLRLGPRQMLTWGAIAAAVIVALAVALSIALREAPPGPDDYVATTGGQVRPGKPRPQTPWQALARHVIGKDGLTARPRPPAAPVKPLVVGSRIQTGATQRRRVALPDGSVLYVNQTTKLLVAGRRHVRLAIGEVYVEVAPTRPGRAKFTVTTPTRTVSALGTKFAVRVGSAGTKVAVVQGTVQVSGYSGLLHAGRQLDCGRGQDEGKLAAIPRASHVLAWTKDLVAAAESPLVPDSKHAGGALIAVDTQGQEARLSLRKYHVDVHVEAGFARTTIDQTYFNHMNRRLEGTFYFPLPPDASISRLAMYVNGKLMEGGMAERAHARYVFEDIMHTRRDPALLEWVDGNTFKMRVFPLEARQEKRIIISYTQRLESLYGQTEYRFPGGHNMPLVGEWSFHARAVGAADLDWACPTHDLKAAKKSGDLLLDIKLKAVKPDADVVVHLFDEDPLAQATDFERFSSAEHEAHRYLMLRYRPNLKDPEQRLAAGVGAAPAPRPARDWVFLFESSGDRDPLLARAQVDVIKTMLAHVEHDDRFTVLTAGTHVRTWAESPQPASVENVKAAVTFLEKSHLVGALDLEGAFAAAGEVLREAENPYLVHVGTGIGVLGERQTDRLVKLIPTGTRYVGVGVGKRWSRSFMKEAAAQTGGYFAHVNPDEDVNWRAFEVISTLNTPRLLNVKIACEGVQAQWLCFTDSVAQGEELCAVARFDREVMLPQVVTVTGTLDGKPYSRQIAVQNVAPEADYLPRFWAKLEIDRLVAAGAAANRDKIIALSKAMYVMSPFTSLLVLENEAMYKQYKVDRGRKDHWALYPAPAKIKVVYEPDPRWTTRRPPRDAEAEKKKPTAEEVLNTILIRIPPQVLRWPNHPNYGGGQSLTALQVLSGAYALPYSYGYSGGGGGGSGGRWTSDDGWVLDVNGSVSAERRFVSLAGGYFSDARRGGPGSVWYSMGGKLAEGLGPVDALEIAGNKRLLGTRGKRLSALFRRGLIPMTRGRLEWGRRGRLTETMDEDGEWLGRLSRSGEEIEALRRFRGRRPTSPFGDRLLGRPRPVASAMPVPATRPAGFLFATPEPPAAFGLLPAMTDAIQLHWKESRSLRAGGLHHRLRTGLRRRNVLYQRPRFTGHYRVFSDLVAYAPGLNTTWADIQAAVEAEARPDKAAAPGRIDPKARTLIDKARRSGFSAVTFPDGNGKPAVTVLFDGAGRYAWSRTTWAGLRERVICDGKTLWHLYDEIGLGAKRTVSRFHRAEFCSIVPWVLPPAEDIARGANVLHVGARTVAISPVGAEAAKDEDGKPVPYFRVELLFAADGRLAERRLVEMPGKKTQYRQTYGRDGAVKWLDEKGKVLATTKLPLRLTPAPEPDLTPDTSKLVVLPMPFRTRQHVWQTVQPKHGNRYELWDADDALALIASSLAHKSWSELYNIIGQRFAGKGDRRLGFYTLLMAVNDNWDTRNLHHFRSGKVHLDPVRDHRRSPLAKYIAQWVKSRRAGKWDDLATIGDPGEGFVQNLAGFRYLYFRWNSGKATSGDQAHRRRERERALDYVLACKSPLFGWAILSRIQDHGGDREFYQAVAKASQAFEDVTGLSYVARYEGARALHRSGQYPQAVGLFEKLYAESLKRGVLPLIDSNFRNAFQNAGADGSQRWLKLMRDTSATLIEKNARQAAVVLAWQCWQVGDRPLAEELLAAAMTGTDDKQRVGVALTAFEYLYTTGQRDRANAVLTPLLADETLADNPWLWRLGALAASSRGRTAESLKRLERAMDIEYRELGDIIDLKAVRADYGSLLNRYQQLAQAIATLEQAPPRELLVRVIRAADRWRALDSDDTNACNSAARTLQALGARELAWEYLTTPLAMRPNEAAPWVSMANQLKQQGEFELADRAYASAFQAEATNARILWDRAQLLQQTGKGDRARELYRKIADGKWPRQFNGIQHQARRYLGTR